MDFMSNAESSDMLDGKRKIRAQGVESISPLLSLERKLKGLPAIKAGNIPKKFLDAILAELRAMPASYIPKRAQAAVTCWLELRSDIKIGMLSARSTVRLRSIGCAASRSACEPCGDCKSVKACACALHDDEGSRYDLGGVGTA